MELTDEQYNQVLKFVDGEMEEAEYAAFEAMLNEHEALREEVELYQQIRTLGSSIEQKLSTASLSFSEVKTSEAQDGMMIIKQAREHWENEQEDNLKRKHGIAAIETKKNKTEKPGSVRRMNLWLKLAVAAVLTGVISLAVTLYLGNNAGDAKVAKNNAEANSRANGNTPADTSKNIIQHKPSEQKEDVSSGQTLAKEEVNKIQKQRKDSSRAFETEPLDQVKGDALFADNFKPDAVPKDKEGPLEEAFTFYENNKYKEAIIAFQNADLGPVTRDLDNSEQLFLFYIHYYKALSYMASNSNTSNAIAELKKAMADSPNKAWQTKVEWYLALAYLKKYEVNNAKKWLIQVAKKNAPANYQQKALQLIKQLQ